MTRMRLHDLWRRLRAVLAVIAIAAAAALSSWPSAAALECEGVALDAGCLFTITGGDTSDPDDGFAVTKADSVPLWDFVRERDLQAIGYPISQRWVNGPFTLQAFPEGHPSVGPRQEPHELLQHPGCAGEPLSRGGAAQRPSPPGAGGGSRHRLRHHHRQPPGDPGAGTPRSRRGSSASRTGSTSTDCRSATRSARSTTTRRACRCSARSGRCS